MKTQIGVASTLILGGKSACVAATAEIALELYRETNRSFIGIVIQTIFTSPIHVAHLRAIQYSNLIVLRDHPQVQLVVSVAQDLLIDTIFGFNFRREYAKLFL